MNRMNNEFVSFIVPAFNAQDSILQTLSSIGQQNHPAQKDVIIIDDGSTDQTHTLVIDWINNNGHDYHDCSFRLIRQPNGGEAVAINRGLQESRAPYIAWVESDVILNQDWLGELLTELKKDNVAGAGGLLMPNEDEPAIAKIFGYEIAYKIMSNKENVKHITSANALYRREVFDQLGHCREELGESSFDSEYNQRIRDAGYALRFNSNAKAWHRYKTRLWDCVKRSWWYGFRRPYVSTQVLYPFDRWISVWVLASGLTLPAIILMPWQVSIAWLLVLFILIFHVGYSLFLYVAFRDRCLLVSAPVYWVRNAVFFYAYLCGWGSRLLRVFKRPDKRS